LPDVGQVDVAGGAHDGGFTFAGGQELEPCLQGALLRNGERGRLGWRR
jgi:hypothetical protein